LQTSGRRTGQRTGRSPKDKFIVQEDNLREEIAWGPVNQPFSPERFESLYHRLLAYLQGHDLFVQDCWGGAHPKYRVPLRIITEYAGPISRRQLFIRPDRTATTEHVPRFTIICCQIPRRPRNWTKPIPSLYNRCISRATGDHLGGTSYAADQ
jgi:ATP-dependent phosphoenolpyruvate carboxykinase